MRVISKLDESKIRLTLKTKHYQYTVYVKEEKCMPDENEYYVTDGGGHGTPIEMTPELEELISETENKIKDLYPHLFADQH